MTRLQQKYQQEVVPELMKAFGYKNPLQVTKIKKVVINMGVSDPQDPRERRKIMDNIVQQLGVIAGQRPVVTKARKSISNFKLRQGDPLGVMVTLRGKLMWEFLDKLVAITLPRVKDFRGVSRKAFDGQGNYSLGLEEQIVFPEVDYDKIDRIRGLQVNIITTNKSDAETMKLLELIGVPFEKEDSKK